MSNRNHDIPRPLPCGGDPLDTACGIILPTPGNRSEPDAGIPITERSQSLNLCRACLNLPRPQGLVKINPCSEA